MQRAWVIGVGLFGAVWVGVSPRVCVAAPPTGEQLAEAPQADSPRVTRRWYGWQTLSTDAAAGALFLAAIAADHNAPLYGASAVTFSVGAPAIHIAHGNWQRSLASFALHVFTPMCGAVIGGGTTAPAASTADDSQDPARRILMGVGIGGLLASAVDGLFLAYETRAPQPPPAGNQLVRLDPLPQLMVLRQGVALGYSGQF